ncbi:MULTISPECIES: hypothetical protein [unclassified Corallococcus]|nr:MULTISPECIES: hypothetical protein [unclassified Corallococcus]
MAWWNCILVVDDDLDLLRAYVDLDVLLGAVAAYVRPAGSQAHPPQ